MADGDGYQYRGTRASNKKRAWWDLQEAVIDEAREKFGLSPPKLQQEADLEVQLAWNRDNTGQPWEKLRIWHQPTALRIRAIRERQRAAAIGAASASPTPGTPTSPAPTTPQSQQQWQQQRQTAAQPSTASASPVTCFGFVVCSG